MRDHYTAENNEAETAALAHITQVHTKFTYKNYSNLLTCGVYVLIGGQPFAPQFKAK